MPFEMIHFRDSDKIIRRKKLTGDVKATLEYVHDALQGTIQRGELLRQALSEFGWRENGSLNILENRRYAYKGFKKGIALEGSFASFEYLLTGLARLQVGFDKKQIDAGILMLTSARSEKSSLGSSRDLAVAEVEAFYPTISMPVAIALFDLGAPVISDGYEEGGDGNGVSVSSDQEKEAEKPPREREESNQFIEVSNRSIEFESPIVDSRQDKTRPLPPSSVKINTENIIGQL